MPRVNFLTAFATAAKLFMWLGALWLMAAFVWNGVDGVIAFLHREVIVGQHHALVVALLYGLAAIAMGAVAEEMLNDVLRKFLPA